jgi:CBS domain containing-hemolysin-like protein
MVPIDKIPCVSYHGVVGDVRNHLYDGDVKYIPLYHEKINNIFGIAYSQDLLNVSDSSLVKDIARSPWFIIETNTIFQVINQFRKNNQKIAIVLDKEGSVIGVLSLSKIIDEIFSGILLNKEALDEHARVYLDKSFLLDTKVSDLKRLFKIFVTEQPNDTLENIMGKKLGHSPKDKESVLIGEYELTFESATFPQDRRIRVKTRM